MAISGVTFADRLPLCTAHAHELHSIMDAKRLVVALALSASLLEAATVYQETDGIVIMEAENTASPLGKWKVETDLPGFTGRGYLQFTGNDFRLGAPNSPLVYHFQIDREGTYVLDLRCARVAVEGHPDWANDCYVRVIGDFEAGPGPNDFPRANASLHMLRTDTKFFGGKPDAWEWAEGDWAITGGRLDAGGRMNKRKAVYRFKAGQPYVLVVSGRSKGFRIDRIVFRHVDVPKPSAHDLKLDESPVVEGETAAPDQRDVPVEAGDFDAESHPGDDAVIARKDGVVAAIADGSWIRFDAFDFGAGHDGCLVIVAANANADPATVEVRLDTATGPLLAKVPVFPTWGWEHLEDFAVNVPSVAGKRDLFLVFRGGPGEILRLRELMVRSGETVDERASTLPIRPPAGRLAYVADGNSPDPDDIGGTAAALAMLRVAGLADRLVYCAHSCDLVKAENISEAMERKRQQLMQTSCEGTAERWGGFEGLTFWNCRTQTAEAIDALAAEINRSSAEDPLWIVEAGEPDIIGFALEKADPQKRPFVKILTHHPVNDGSGDHFTWREILDFGVEVVRIPDQNGTSLRNGLQRPEWAFAWMREHPDPRIRWIWEQGKIAEQDPVVGFQHGKIDISDAGMILFWITGADEHGGYRQPTVHDVRLLFSGELNFETR